MLLLYTTLNSAMKKRRRPTPDPPPSATGRAKVVSLSCPDCAGVLHIEEEGPRDHHVFCCQVGHRYAGQSLLQAKEEQLERVLWSAAVLLKQLGDAYERSFKERPGMSHEQKSAQRRIREVRKQSLAMRAIIEGSHASR